MLAKSKGAAHDVAKVRRRGVGGLGSNGDGGAPSTFLGIAAGAGKYQSAMQTWGPIIDSAASQVASMPNNSFADSLARMNAFATALHNAKLQGA